MGAQTHGSGGMASVRENEAELGPRGPSKGKRGSVSVSHLRYMAEIRGLNHILGCTPLIGQIPPALF